MTNLPSPRRLARPLLIALSALALLAALLGPSQTLAQTRGASCPSDARAGKPRHGAHACTHPSHRSTARHAAKRRAGHAHAKAKGKGKAKGTDKGKAKGTRAAHGAGATVFVPARCEDGAIPVAGAGGSFSCEDGSQPSCEDGAAPTRSRGGAGLVCAVSSGEEAQASAGEEVECEEAATEAAEPEEESGCPAAAAAGSGSGEGACDAAGCEAEA